MESKEQIQLIANIIKPAYCNKSDEDCNVCMTGCRPYQEAERLYEKGCRVDTTLIKHVFRDLDKSIVHNENGRYIPESVIHQLKKKYKID